MKHLIWEREREMSPAAPQTWQDWQLGRTNQVILFRLWTEHRMKVYVYNNMKIGQSEMYNHETGPMNSEHLLYQCPLQAGCVARQNPMNEKM